MYPPMGPIKFQRNYSFAEAAATASDNDMLDDNLTNHLNVHFGLICFNFAFMPLRFDGTFGEYLSRSTLKRNLLKEYIGKKLWRTDTLVHHCKTN
ncbi:hypothetical protein, partial [uncultured Tateyamaria sp.]|uniref:hypothetical protein n=1 Tax=uncultured Tateyamaria sp. TaxID=455651 RepID=UPI00260D87BD